MHELNVHKRTEQLELPDTSKSVAIQSTNLSQKNKKTKKMKMVLFVHRGLIDYISSFKEVELTVLLYHFFER